jgi:toxin YoeB
MDVEYKKKALKDIEFWKKSGNKSIQKKISQLIDDSCKHPLTGDGKPEPLKYELTGLWSRRINAEHRIIYEVSGNQINIISLKGHYE